MSTSPKHYSDQVARKLVLSGLVQGVGFRPFIYRLATQHELTGWVKNCIGRVEIHIQGQEDALQDFVDGIFTQKPAIAAPVLESDDPAEPAEHTRFVILQSKDDGSADISVPTDLFLCDDCLREMNDPEDRRYRYPFINCTQCGPRYTLIQKLPYDRPNTTMADFELCADCHKEYENPADRRFHAEPIACPVCGPSLSLQQGDIQIDDSEEALTHAVKQLRDGKIIAVKGIGGYHVMCDASNDQAVKQLRDKKPRPHKPLAIMFPSPVDAPFNFIEQSVVLNDTEKAFLSQPARPILLTQKKRGQNNNESPLSKQIAPGLNEIGIMLPYSPLHHLLLDTFGGPLVATSANISGEPVLTDNDDVDKRLTHVADACLHHDRPIARPADDPVFRMIHSRPRPIRTGRGNTPLELALPFKLQVPVLAVGSHMKNVIALAWGDRAVISPHIGEMDSARSLDVFEHTITDLQKLYAIKAQHIICDAHPGYTTTRWAKQNAEKLGIAVTPVLHHHAHASSAYYECGSHLPDTTEYIMVFTWDGVGYGEDGTSWGGETFIGRPDRWQRIATIRPFRLPGGDKAGREPWRSAAALCWESDAAYDDIPETDPLLKQAWQREINSPVTTSVGRLFDAAAALSGLRTHASFEGQGPMELEALCSHNEQAADPVRLGLNENKGLLTTDWQPLISMLLDADMSRKQRAAIFHSSLAHAILQQAESIREKYGIDIVSFSGGVFQNRVLTEQAIALLSENNFQVHLPELIPVNDAGISFGQIIEYGYSCKHIQPKNN
jgi:hydrogenase maturation protein HypF